MRRVVLFAVLLVLMLAWPATASALLVPANMPIFEFAKSGPGVAADSFQALAMSRGQLYAVGTMNSATHGADGYVVRFADIHGWSHRYDGPAHSADSGDAIVGCPTGGVYVAFSSQSGAGNSDIVVARYGAGGTRLWERRWRGALASNDYAHRISVDGAGNVYVAGRSLPGVVLLKYRPNGSRAWARTYQPGGLSAWVADMYVSSGGNVYLAGGRGPLFGVSDGLLLKYSTGGKRLWARTPSETASLSERLTALCRCPKGGVYAVGVTGDGGGDSDATIYRYNGYGNQRLFARFGTGDGQDQGFNDCALDSKGRVAVCGYWGTAFSGAQYWAGVLTPSGVFAWEAKDGTLFADDARVLVIDSKDRVTVAGTFRDSGDTRDVLRVDAYTVAGVPRWASMTGTTDGSARPFGIVRRSSTNLWVCGEKARPGGDWAGLVLGWNLATP